MKQNNKITPLSQWPTEALVMCFRRNKYCRTHLPFNYRLKYNKKTCKWEYWLPFYGSWTDEEGNTWNPITIGYTLYDKIPKEYTKVYGNRHGGKIAFTFEGMYWEGKLAEVYNELSKRPHINLNGAKDFRKWKIEYKKSLKK